VATRERATELCGQCAQLAGLARTIDEEAQSVFSVAELRDQVAAGHPLRPCVGPSPAALVEWQVDAKSLQMAKDALELDDEENA